MKQMSKYISNIGFIYTVAVVIVIFMHIFDENKTVDVMSLLNLFLIVCTTQIVSKIMDYIMIKPEIVHMTLELLVIEVIVLVLGYVFGNLDFQTPIHIIINTLIVALVYVMTVVHYSISAIITADQINHYLDNKG